MDRPLRILVLIGLCLILLVGCQPNQSGQTPHNLDAHTSASLSTSASRWLSEHAIDDFDKTIFQGDIGQESVVTFDFQAETARQFFPDLHWEPQFVATVVIALDRAQTDAELRGWKDLLSVNDEIGLWRHPQSDAPFMQAIQSSLDRGKSYAKTINLFGQIAKQGRLKPNRTDSPILILFDYQAADLMRQGRELELVIPQEGTTSYQVGILSPDPIQLAEDTENRLLQAGYRLPDGRADSSIYPVANYGLVRSYQSSDITTQVMTSATRTLRRWIMSSRRFAASDTLEFFTINLIYLCLIIIWLGTVLYRVIVPSIRQAAIVMSAMLIGWTILRFVKWLLPGNGVGQRLLWYLFYLFFLGLPLVAVWLAVRLDAEKPMPRWFRILAGTQVGLFLLVLTNDLHQWVFRFDQGPNWINDYSYGLGYYLCLFGVIVCLIGALYHLIHKSHRSGTGAFALIGLFGLLISYITGYILRSPLAWDSDITLVIGLFAIMLFETSLQVGILPSNRKYVTIFRHSPLNLRVFDKTGKVMFQELKRNLRWKAPPLVTDEALFHPPHDSNTLQFIQPVQGGYSYWQQDISQVNRLREELADTVNRLERANELLVEKTKISQFLSDAKLRRQVIDQLEEVVAEKTALLEERMEYLPEAANVSRETARIVLLIGYIKRHCNLYFHRHEKQTVTGSELASYLTELGELARHAGAQVIITEHFGDEVSLNTASLIVDFYYQLFDWMSLAPSSTSLVQLYRGSKPVHMTITTSLNVKQFVVDDSLSQALEAAGATLRWHETEDMNGLHLLIGGES